MNAWAIIWVPCIAILVSVFLSRGIWDMRGSILAVLPPVPSEEECAAVIEAAEAFLRGDR